MALTEPSWKNPKGFKFPPVEKEPKAAKPEEAKAAKPEEAKAKAAEPEGKKGK